MSCLSKKENIPADTCMCQTAAKYTLMVVCEMLLVAKYVTKRIRVASEAGTGGICIIIILCKS